MKTNPDFVDIPKDELKDLMPENMKDYTKSLIVDFAGFARRNLLYIPTAAASLLAAISIFISAKGLTGTDWMISVTPSFIFILLFVVAVYFWQLTEKLEEDIDYLSDELAEIKGLIRRMQK